MSAEPYSRYYEDHLGITSSSLTNLRKDAELNDLPQAWLDAIAFFVLCQDSSGKSIRTVRNRRGAIAAMARATGTESPADVTRQAAVTYIAADRKRRKTADGAASHFKCLSSFWSWWSAEENLPNPIAGLPRPKTDGNSHPGPVRRAAGGRLRRHGRPLDAGAA